jgi:hypothetical protein
MRNLDRLWTRTAVGSFRLSPRPESLKTKHSTLNPKPETRNAKQASHAATGRTARPIMHIHTHTFMYVYIYIHTYKYMHGYICIYVCVCIYICVCVFVDVYICMHTCIYIYICIYINRYMSSTRNREQASHAATGRIDRPSTPTPSA